MSRSIPSFVILGALLGVSSIASAQDALVEQERTRIQAHLAHVEMVLSRRDTSHLTDAQRAARARHLERLHAYREAGEFPRNTRHPDDYVPYFIDDRGTACAVGYLMIEDGADELAEQVRQRENNAYVPDMTTPGLGDWAQGSGFTVDELAMIQPSYCGPEFDAGPCGGGGGGGGCSVGGQPGPAGLGALVALAAFGLVLRRRRNR